MKKRPRINRSVIATTSKSQAKMKVAYQARHEFIEKMMLLKESKDGAHKYYVYMFGAFKEISPSQIDMYLAGGFEIVER